MTSSTTAPATELARGLLDLGLRGLAAIVDDFLAAALKRRLTPVQVLEELVRVEQQDRARRGVESRLRRSRIGSFKPIADFDWNWPEQIDRALIERALALHFLGEGANVLTVGPHGLGKTMILKNIAHQAVLAGHNVLFTTAARMLTDLSGQESPRALERRIGHYARVAVLAVDELGYLSYDNRAADLLFEVVSRRHDARKPILLSTNLAFSDWTTVFPNATSTVALVDRLSHRADVIQIKGKSWRRKEAMERNKNRETKGDQP